MRPINSMTNLVNWKRRTVFSRVFRYLYLQFWDSLETESIFLYYCFYFELWTYINCLFGLKVINLQVFWLTYEWFYRSLLFYEHQSCRSILSAFYYFHGDRGVTQTTLGKQMIETCNFMFLWEHIIQNTYIPT